MTKTLRALSYQMTPENGISMGEEEKKLGHSMPLQRDKYFSAIPKFPVENMLSERGNGFKIAMNALNVGSHQASSCHAWMVKDGCLTKLLALPISASSSKRRLQTLVPSNKNWPTWPPFYMPVKPLAIELQRILKTALHFAKRLEIAIKKQN